MNTILKISFLNFYYYLLVIQKTIYLPIYLSINPCNIGLYRLQGCDIRGNQCGYANVTYIICEFLKIWFISRNF